MGFLDGVKDRFGFGQRQEWADPNAYDAYGYEGVPQDGYAYEEGFEPADDGMYYDDGQGSDVVSFDSYNPDTFKNVNVSSSHEPEVAPLTGGYSSSRSYGSSRSARSRRTYSTDAVEGATWSTPSDPAFLDNMYTDSPSGRDVLDQIGATQSHASASDPYSQFDSDIRRIHRDPGAHLEIVTPKVYSDVEKIATAAKAGKSVVLTLSGTKPDLAKRILDFSFGVASALNKNVDKADSMVFVISKGTEVLSGDEREYLKKKGVLK